jgi:hypothetical protein
MPGSENIPLTAPLNIFGRDDYALVIALLSETHGTVYFHLPNHKF